MEFYNREKEIKDLLNIIRQEPNFITFIYGPINSGKTVLMYHLVNEVLSRQEKKYATFYINLRGYSITKREEFLKVLFEVYDEDTFKKKFDRILKGMEKYHKAIPVIRSIWREFFYGEKSFDAFKHVENFLQELYDKGLKPIIIFDELQVIKDIKIDNFLIYRLFNLFIRLTKELKLCHVFAITSDSTFIERIYNEAMLQGRCEYYLVDDFDKETVEKILREKGFNDKEINIVWHYFGGKPIYISRVIEERRVGGDIKELCEKFQRVRNRQIKDLLYSLRREDKRKYENVIEILKIFLQRDSFEYEELTNEILWLIDKNILFLDPISGKIKPQSHLEWNAIKNLLSNVER